MAHYGRHFGSALGQRGQPCAADSGSAAYAGFWFSAGSQGAHCGSLAQCILQWHGHLGTPTYGAIPMGHGSGRLRALDHPSANTRMAPRATDTKQHGGFLTFPQRTLWAAGCGTYLGTLLSFVGSGGRCRVGRDSIHKRRPWRASLVHAADANSGTLRTTSIVLTGLLWVLCHARARLLSPWLSNGECRERQPWQQGVGQCVAVHRSTSFHHLSLCHNHAQANRHAPLCTLPVGHEPLGKPMYQWFRHTRTQTDLRPGPKSTPSNAPSPLASANDPAAQPS